MRVKVMRRGAVRLEGEIVDARDGSYYLMLDGHPGEVFRFDRTRQRRRVRYQPVAKSLRHLGKVELVPEED